MAKTRRSYTGGAASTTTDSSIASSGTTSFTIAAYTGWPYGSAPFHVVVEPGTSNEEKILVTRTGATDTTINIYATPSVAANRGVDGTTAFAHNSASTVYPVFTAADADEANELASTLTTQGDILIHGASTFGRVGIGTAAQVLRVNSGATAPEWGQVATAGIADDAVTAAKIAANAVGASEIATGAVGSDELASDSVITAKILDANVTLAKLATAVQNLLVPAGTITATIRSTADTGYLLLNGSTITGANTLYPSLWDILPTSWKSGTSLVLPNTANQLLGGAGTITLGALGGDNTILEANLPSHAHTLASHTHTLSHTHTVNPPSTPLTISDPGHAHVSGVVIRTSSGTFGGAASGHGGTSTTDSADAGIVANTTGISGSVDIAEFTSGGASATTTSGPSVTNTGSAGSGTDLKVEQLAVNYQIKAH
jgi:hypothetical protein